MPDTWGKFNGDYAKWQSFRDRFMAGVHNNEKVKKIFKFQYLQTACIGEAKGALGEWDLTEENYEKAWQRLQSIYEDDYMQVQSFMRKLLGIPHMDQASSKSIRDLIDTVHQCVHGLARYIATENIDPFVVFLVIDRMDRNTYRAWEKHRPGLSKPQQNEEAGAGSINRNPGKHIPTWKEVEAFLESEVTIYVHDEKRTESTKGSAENLSARSHAQKSFVRASTSTAQTFNSRASTQSNVPSFLKCILCEGTHPLYKCEVFIGMNLAGRKAHVEKYKLCKRCLRPFDGDVTCAKEECMQTCPRCPNNQYHNSMICPSKEARKQTALLARNTKTETQDTLKRKSESNAD